MVQAPPPNQHEQQLPKSARAYLSRTKDHGSRSLDRHRRGNRLRATVEVPGRAPGSRYAVEGDRSLGYDLPVLAPPAGGGSTTAQRS